jgi:hypothetical protein
MKKCLIFLILVLSIVFWYSYADASDITLDTNTGIGHFDNMNCDTPLNAGNTWAYSFNDGGWNVDFTSTSENVVYYPTIAYMVRQTMGYNNSLNCDFNLTSLGNWLGNGSYGVRFITDTITYTYYFERTAGVWAYTPPIPPDTTSRIDSISVSTSTNKVNLTGYWNATTTSGVYEQLEFYQTNSIFGQEDYFTINATTSGAFNINFDYRNVATPYVGTTTIPLTSNQIFYANLYEKNNAYYNPFGEYDFRYSTLLDATSTSLTASTTNTFNISTSTIVDYPEYECSISSITGCIKNALIWTFYPTQATIGRYYALVELIQKKAPVGYFTITKNAINGLSATSTSAFSITIPAHLKSYIFNPIDFGLASIFWVYLIFSFYKRLKHLQI